MSTLQIQGQEFKKQVILREAAEILAQKPYEAVTMDEVAKALGCGKSTLYKYFESKDLLFAGVIYAQLEAFAREIEENCFHEPDTPKALENSLMLSFRFYRRNSQLFSSWLRYESNSEVTEELFQKVHDLMAQKQLNVAALFRRAIAEGIVRPDFDPCALANLIERFVLSGVFSPLDGDIGDEAGVLRTLQQLLRTGILTAKAQEPAAGGFKPSNQS